MLVRVSPDAEGEINTPAAPQIVLCAVDEPLATAWLSVAEGRAGIRVHRGSVLDIIAEAVVSPANSYGWMRGG
ncbi:MAG TPA: phage tail protein, partial [Umezawaea sp.]|nr:phage tail protein [Umezawaea sp.]